MKIAEVTQPSDKQLFEQLDQDQTTGLSTPDMIKLVRQHQSGQWSEPMTADEVEALLRKWTSASSL